MTNKFKLLLQLLAFAFFAYLPLYSNATITITGGTWTGYGFGTVVTDPDITISGIFTIDDDATFDNCPNIKMAPGAIIIVQDGKTFTVDNSHIYTPGDYLWKGISVEGTPTSGGFIKMTETIVEDAEVAMDGAPTAMWGVSMRANYSFELYRVTFNRNLVSIQKEASTIIISEQPKLYILF